jgi:hypothetical protein
LRDDAFGRFRGLVARKETRDDFVQRDGRGKSDRQAPRIIAVLELSDG